MTRRQGGYGSRCLTGLATLSLAGTLACGFALTGCSGDSGNGGGDSGADTSTPDTGTPETGGGQDAKQDTTPPPVDSGSPCATPTFAPGAGTVSAGTSVTVSSAGLPMSGLIYFTTDGTQPTTSSRALASGGTIVVNQTETIKAQAIAPGVCTASQVASADYTVPPPEGGTPEGGMTLPTCPTPTFNHPDGTVLQPGQNIVISATGLTTGEYIVFTTDNSLATDNSPIYNQGTVGVQVTQSPTYFHAIVTSLGTVCKDSPQATATYTVAQPEGGTPDGGNGVTPPIPSFAPTGAQATQPNDFTVTLASAGAAAICYTMGASGSVAAPTCTTTATSATCSGGTLTYTAPIAINGSVTTAGQVEIDAIACDPGAAPSGVGKELYTLQAGTPSMTPTAGTYTFSSTLTGAFSSTTSGASIFYTINGGTPSCTAPVAGQLTYAGPFALQTGSYQAVACKTGYIGSAASAANAVTVDLTAPIVTPAAGTYSIALGASVANSAANPSGSWLCSSVLPGGGGGSAPACGAATGTCVAPSVAGTTPPTVANGGTIQAIACAPAGLSNSPMTTVGPYNLVLGTPFFNPNATNNAGAALTTFQTAGTPITGNAGTSLTISEPAGDLTAGAFCFMKDGQFAAGAVCGTTTTGASTDCAQGTVAPITNGVGDLTVGATVSYTDGDFVTVVACPTIAGAGAIGNSAGYASVGPLTLSFVANGTVAGPAVTQSSATGTGNAQQAITTPVAINTNNTAATLCYSTDNSTPACTPGVATATCNPVTGVTNQTMTIQITNPGAGYLMAPVPIVTPQVGGGAAGTSGNGVCTGVPVATIGASGQVTGVTVTGCSGYTVSPTVTFNNPANTTQAAATAVVNETVTVTVTAGGSGYTQAHTTMTLKAPGSNTDLCTNGDFNCAVVIGTGAKAGQVISATATSTGASAHPTGTLNVAFVDTADPGTGATGTATNAQAVVVTVNTPGFDYTSAPGVTLIDNGAIGNGACTSVVATLGAAGAGGNDPGGRSVTAITATGCSGFDGTQPTVVIDDETPTTVANAIGVGSNMWVLPTLQTATTLKVDACATGLTTSPNTTVNYTFSLKNPTIASTAANLTTPLSDRNEVTIKTQSDFTDAFIVYMITPNDAANTAPAIAPACSGAGANPANGAVTVTGSSVTLTPAQLPPGTASPRIDAIACGTNQTASGVVHALFTGPGGTAVDYPYITSTANNASVTSKLASALTSPSYAPAGAPRRVQTITTDNLVTATITNPSSVAGSFLCYRTNATDPSGCGCATGADVKVTAPTATVNVTQSGTSIHAIACAPAVGATSPLPSAVSTATYTLAITAPKLTPSTTLACPSSYTLGLDPAAADNADGVTTGTVTTCWAMSTFNGCAGGTTGAGDPITCFTTATGPISFSGNTAASVFVNQCAVNFPTRGPTQLAITPLDPYTPPTVAIDGVLGEWTTKELLAGSAAGFQGGLTYTTASPVVLDLAAGGFTGGNSVEAVFYLSNPANAVLAGGTNPNATTTPEVGATTLPFAAEYAIVVPLSANCAQGVCVPTAFSNNGTAWAAINAPTVTAAVVESASPTGVEIQVTAAGGKFPLLVGATTVDAAGMVTGGAVTETWPTFNAAWGFVSDGLNVCQTPASTLQ